MEIQKTNQEKYKKENYIGLRKYKGTFHAHTGKNLENPELENSLLKCNLI